jgi:hypothetical protein
MIAM